MATDRSAPDGLLFPGPPRRQPRGHWLRPPSPIVEGLRIGLLGGSFNPAHEGHRHASRLALKALHLDAVWWLVSPQNPLKPTEGMAALTTRLKQAGGVARHPRIRVTDLEAALGTRFTIDTVAALKRRFPQLRFVWLMGSDNLVQFPRWRRWQDIFRALPIAVIARPGSAVAARLSKPARRFQRAFTAPDRLLAVDLPAWTMIDAKRSGQSSSAMRRAGASP